MVEYVLLPVAEIIRDIRAQPRQEINIKLVAEYAVSMADGNGFPAIVAFEDPKTSKCYLADGWHRHMAADQAGKDDILVELHPPDNDETAARSAILYSTGANAAHGMRRTDADKRRAVLTHLQDKKWGAYSDRKIAEKAKVGHPFVAKVRREYLESVPDVIEPNIVKFERGGKVHQQKRKKAKAGIHSNSRADHDNQQPTDTNGTVSCTLTDISNAFDRLPNDPSNALEIARGEGNWLSARDAISYSKWLIRYATALYQIEAGELARRAGFEKEGRWDPDGVPVESSTERKE